MSTQTIIRCDGQPGGLGTKCRSTADPAFPWHTTATKIRRFWRKHGWHRTTDGRDICPKCWAEKVHKGQISPDWCTECDERRPCGCDPGGWMPLPYEDDGDFDPSAIPDAAA